MKRGGLLRHLRKHGCHLKREGRAHSLWANSTTGAVEAVPRPTEISDVLARKICRGLSIPEIGRVSLANNIVERTGPERPAAHDDRYTATRMMLGGA